MIRRSLGQSGLSAPPIMLGGNVFGWTADRQTSFDVLDAYVDAGGVLIDTADVYSAWLPGHQGGESETLIGEWLRESGRRSSVLIATKVGMLDGEGGKGLEPSRIAAAAEASLRRLGVDAIDIYFAHCDDPEVPIPEYLGAFDKLVRSGKVNAIGASNFTAQRLAEALEVSDVNELAKFSIVQPRYNLVERGEYEGALQDLIVTQGLAAVPYFALASGYLTGKYRHPADLYASQRGEWIRPVMEGCGPQILAVMDQISKEVGASHVAIAIAWLLAQPGVAAPIASATSVSQVRHLMAAIELRLSDDQIERLTVSGGPPQRA